MEEYDFIILGTGLVESVLSANLSLKNMKILQIDKNSSYGAEIRSCNYQELIEIYSAYQEMDEKAEDVCRGNEKLNISTNASNNKKAASVPGNPTKITVNSGITPVDELAKFNYQFSVDLTPKLLLSNGFLQELLATYDISEYITFVLIPNSFIYTDKCYSVPTTEYGCLNSPLIGFWQKPKLIQFMWDVKKYGDLVEKEKCYREKGINIKKDKDQVIFRDTMKQQFEYFKLNNEIQDVIGHAIALNLNDEYLNEHPRLTYDKICLYVSSINSNMGVNSPYVYPLYGLSELAQTFCRKSAVNGTVFRLGTPILSIRGNGYAEECNNSHVEECDNSHVEECEGIEAIVGNKNNDFEKNVSKAPNLKVSQFNDSGDKNFILEFYDPIESKVSRVKAKHIISDPSYVKSLVKPIYSVIRCTCIIKGTPSLLPNDDASQIIFLSKHFNRKNDIFVLILTEKEKACPETYFTALISTIIESDHPKEEIEFVINKLGNVVQRFYRVDHVYEYERKVKNLYVSRSVDHTTHLESVLKNINEIWSQIQGDLNMDKK